MKPGDACPACGAALEAKQAPAIAYRGTLVALRPAPVLPTCMACGDIWLDSAQVRELGVRLEAERVKGAGAAPS